MQGDFSRQTYRPEKHYGRVLLQQGRVQLDADWNEQQIIAQRRLETETLDIVGSAGAPLHASGFQLGLQTGRLTLSAGRYYVQGILVQQDLPKSPLFIDEQPDCPVPFGSPAGTLPGLTAAPVPGRYLAYLDVWERHISSLEDPHIRETALGGPDTCTRAQTVWQAKLLPIAAGAKCSDFGPGWTPSATTGTLQAQVTGTGATDACMIPPTAQYTGLENQLYRVEIHTPGDLSTATFKWSRENASVASLIEASSGQVLTLHDLGRDTVLGFAAGQWVELLDDTAELDFQRGTLLQIDSVDRPRRQVTIKASTPVPSFDLNGHPKLRRWENPDSTPALGIALTGTWQNLEASIQVKFAAGQYRSGDHWVIAARTAVDVNAGVIEWPVDPVTTIPLSLAPLGIVHAYAPLGMVTFAGTAFDPASITDCRKVFTPLTELCGDSGCGCAEAAQPKVGWESVFANIPPNGDASICLPPGDFSLANPLMVSGKGHLKIVGSGPATKIVVSSPEGGLLFQDCKSVEISDLAIQAGTLSEKGGLQGVLDFGGVPRVEVRSVVLRNASGAAHGSAGIRILDTGIQGKAVPLVARVIGCDLVVGSLQEGILVVNPERVTIEDNHIRLDPEAKPPEPQFFRTNLVLRASLRKQLLTGMSLAARTRPQPNAAVEGNALAPTGAPAEVRALRILHRPGELALVANERVTLAGHTVQFRTDAQLVGKWQGLADKVIAANNISSGQDLILALNKVASDLVLGRAANTDQAFTKFLGAMFEQDLVAGNRGIVVGGSLGRDVRINGNTIRGFIKGIHCGFSHHGQAPGEHDQGVVVRIQDNTVDVHLPNAIARERHGIFVGNVGSAWIENNVVTVLRGSQAAQRAIDGIRAYGVFGRILIIRANELLGVTTGILVHPLRTLVHEKTKNQWLVADNISPNAQAAVVAPNSVRKVENYA